MTHRFRLASASIRELLRASRRAFVAIALGCAPPLPAPAPSAPPEPPAPPAPPAVTTPAPPCLRIVHIEVVKSERRLQATCERGAVVALAVALGRNADGAKRRSGDQRTPEGAYRIAGPARPSRFHRFLPIDYPAVADAAAAFSEGALSESDYLRIVRAHRDGRFPPQDTPLGSSLGFHGEGPRWRGESEHLDWTTGCIAMADDAIDFLAARASPGTPVVIRP